MQVLGSGVAVSRGWLLSSIARGIERVSVGLHWGIGALLAGAGGALGSAGGTLRETGQHLHKRVACL